MKINDGMGKYMSIQICTSCFWTIPRSVLGLHVITSNYLKIVKS